ncbi:FG-GAP repeat domain-containing protein [Streptomyces sp. NBC_00316]|uniref:FG-GAP repeat domain-containing protein n=1 Tax=Streptomyces sp. NBC_00316 TaxID=2975710 RepID=UPI002E2ABF54|nr:VCBS repeat-containing protein [Streptomyces sp. NBC_00316]
MHRPFIRLAAAGATIAGLLGTGIAAAAPVAAEDSYSFTLEDYTLAPGDPIIPHPTATGAADGYLVYAFGTGPLTGPAGQGAGLPAGVTYAEEQFFHCKPITGYTAVYKCPVSSASNASAPRLLVSDDAADMTTAHYGVAYAPTGTDLAAAAEQAQTAAARPADATHGTGQIVVKTAEHAARNTLAFTTPDVPAGTATKHKLHIHAVDSGKLVIWFTPQTGQPSWDDHAVDIRVTAVTSGSGAQCALHPEYTVIDPAYIVTCDVATGDTDIEYTLYAAPGTESWKLTTQVRYQIYSGGSHWVTAQRGFAIQGTPVRERARLQARDKTGAVYDYQGTGNGDTPFKPRTATGLNDGAYTQIARVSPLMLDKTAGDLAFRDDAGALWYHRGGSTSSHLRVGGGWNVYNNLTGGGDLTGDTRPDLLARDKDGVLWLYKGTGTNTVLATRTRVGGGWNTYTALAGSNDLTGDHRPDLLARDTSGVLWLYRGTSNATTPFAPRVRVGGGWNAYNQLVVTGDLNSDGRPDLVAPDSAGVLWLYRGTGNATAPFESRTRVGGGWNTYNHLI